ncbi:hypothetical protein SNE25_26170 [Mucilaginibacter sabulilitoris]|uniref:Beta-lactamase-inhibitor-like PepSY-like domain-containing protein n=1 Tax=Mucilaginibacter sabulilitoris TaxID=1173583 RepID=A0ABZ0TNQ9_9SPHI|nr:hypothetical protein [Mucilaginibacter sabulilitoris]WPU92815.1 hypothetical protein SNE25_26170 [Mucilaginibacter sabulilitoris]
MKALNAFMITLAVCSFGFSGCKQIVKSVKDTFKPKPNTPVLSKPVQVQSIIDSSTNQAIIQIQQQLTTALSKVHMTTHTTKTVHKKNINFLINTAALRNAEMTLRNLPQYRGKEIFIYQSAHFYDNGSISIMLRHPENPDYVDSYEYQNGFWSKPKPEQLSVNADIDNRSVSLDEVDFTSIANITRLYNQKAAQIEGAKPTTSAYMVVWDKVMRWYPTTINGNRERYSIQFNSDGTLKDFRRD